LIRTLTRHIYLNQRGFSIIFTPNNRANRGAWVSYIQEWNSGQ
jgi:hypothetical protein